MPKENPKDKLINKLKEINAPAILEEVSNLFELQVPETVYHTNDQQKKAIEKAKEQIKNPDIILQQYLPQIKKLMQQHDVQSAYAFGSAVGNCSLGLELRLTTASHKKIIPHKAGRFKKVKDGLLCGFSRVSATGD